MECIGRRQRSKRALLACLFSLIFALFQSESLGGPTGKRTVEGSLPNKPAARPCCLLASQPALPWALFPQLDDVFDLSERLDHQYGAGIWAYANRAEVNGLAYTCSVGFIDLGHVRHVADLTYYYYGWLQGATDPGDELETVGHRGFVEITRRLPTDDPDIRLQLARSIAYDESIFYEIETYWSKLSGQHHSSFSPEDMVSNLIGAYVGEQAIRYMRGKAVNYDIAVTRVLQRTLERLRTLPAEQTRMLLSRIDNSWFFGSSQSLSYLRRRNFEHSPVTPWRLEDVEECADTTAFLEAVRPPPPRLHDYYVATYRIPRIFTNAVLRNLFEISPGFSFTMDSRRSKYISSTDFVREITRIKNHARATYGPHFDQR